MHSTVLIWIISYHLVCCTVVLQRCRLFSEWTHASLRQTVTFLFHCHYTLACVFMADFSLGGKSWWWACFFLFTLFQLEQEVTEFTKRVFAVAFTDSVHGLAFDTPTEVSSFYEQVMCDSQIDDGRILLQFSFGNLRCEWGLGHDPFSQNRIRFDQILWRDW